MSFGYPVWSPFTTYNGGDTVGYNGLAYVANAIVSGTAPLPANAFWSLITPTGGGGGGGGVTNPLTANLDCATYDVFNGTTFNSTTVECDTIDPKPGSLATFIDVNQSLRVAGAGNDLESVNDVVGRVATLTQSSLNDVFDRAAGIVSYNAGARLTTFESATPPFVAGQGLQVNGDVAALFDVTSSSGANSLNSTASTAATALANAATAQSTANTALALAQYQTTKVFYVSKQGNDANSGTQLAPKLTIQAAINAAQAAPVLSATNFAQIIVDKGKYTENLTFSQGYIVLSGAYGSQMDLNEFTELTGNVTINITSGGSDLFTRQVVIENFQITGTITDSCSVNHTLTLTNGRLFGSNRLLDINPTATEWRCRIENYTISQNTATGSTDSMIRFSGAAVPGANGQRAIIYRLNATNRNNANCIRCEGGATIESMAQSQLESTTSSASAAAIVEFAGAVGSTGLSSFATSTFAYTNSTLKTASPNSCGILVSGAYTALAPKVLFILQCLFSLAGTVHPSNHIIRNVNGVASSTTVMYAQSAAPTDNSPFLGSVRYTARIDSTNLNILAAQSVS